MSHNDSSLEYGRAWVRMKAEPGPLARTRPRAAGPHSGRPCRLDPTRPNRYARRMATGKKAAENLRIACDLHDAGVEMYTAQMRRRFPDASPAEIAELVGAWLRDRPGAPHGDTVGRRVPDHPLLHRDRTSSSS